MIFGIYAVRDICADSFLNPFVAVNDSVAIRQFANACQDPGTIMHTSATDFELHCIGSFDSLNGVIESKPDVIVARGGDFVA